MNIISAAGEESVNQSSHMKLQTVLVPKGATLAGRLVQVRRAFLPAPAVTFTIQFDLLETPHGDVPVTVASMGPSETLRSHQAVSSETRPATITVIGSDHVRFNAGHRWVSKTR